MKNSKKALSLMMTSALVFTSTPHQFIVNALTGYQPGVTVEKNSTGKSDADYQATFVYEDKDERDAVSVSVAGSLQFYKHDDVTDNFIKTGTTAGAKVYDAYHYEKSMFNTGYGLNGDSQSYDLKEVEDERFEITLPLPGNLYYYDYTVTYADGSKVTIQDPANKSEANPTSGHDSGHSIVYVGDASNTAEGQEKIYARTDGKTGSYSFVEYQAVDGTKQPLGVYLPKGYDSSKVYKTIYVSHGGGGNEAEWMGIGAIPNIMDNLIAEDEVADAVVVTMDNAYFNWNYDTIAQNFKENIIPFIEKNYNVSMNVKDRALCGLSMGSMITSTILQQNTELFGAYGCFSGANTQATIKDVEELKNVKIYLTGGNVDMATKATTPEGDVGNPGKTVGLAKILADLGVKYNMDIKDGAHDWGVWRSAFTTFVKDYLWDAQDQTLKYQPGVTVEKNTNPDWDADYTATFVYKDTDKRNAVSVNVQGGFQFYKESEVGSYKGAADNSSIPCYDAYHYEKGMFAGSSSTQTNVMIPYEMTEITDELFQVTIPVPANQYFYAYYVTYENEDTEVKTYDPANLPEKSPSGSDAGWNLFYVGNSGETKGQEYIYPRADKKGNVEYKEYTAIDGTTQYIGVYTPYGYDKNKTYKTIYVSHGGGGNENEWMTIGSVPNIMDNLIANGEIADTIVVTMNNTYFGWDYDKVLPNVVDHIIPYVEENYSVSKNAKDRAFCGLSMGSMTTNQMAKTYPKEFGYFGSFSGGSTDLDKTHYDVDALNDAVLYLTAGNIDMAYNNDMGISSIDYMKLYDELGVKYDFDLLLGSHDWYVWRESFTNFAKDYLWDVEAKDDEVNDKKDNTPSQDTENKVNTSTTNKKENTISKVKTGDQTSITAYIIMLCIGLAGMMVFVYKRKKENL